MIAMKKLIGLLGMIMLVTLCFAQKKEGTLEVYGTAKYKKNSLDGVIVEVFKDGVPTPKQKLIMMVLLI